MDLKLILGEHQLGYAPKKNIGHLKNQESPLLLCMFPIYIMFKLLQIRYPLVQNLQVKHANDSTLPLISPSMQFSNGFPYC